MTESVQVLDCTLRDGGYANDYRFTAQDTYRLCRALEQAGFRYIEVGHGMGLGASSPANGVAAETDESYLRAAREALRTARFGTFFIPGIGRPEHLDAAVDLGMSFVRIGTNIVEFARAEGAVAQAKRLGLEVSYNLMKTYAVDLDRFLEIASIIDSWGVDTICVVDSAGCMDPVGVRRFVSALRERSTIQIGFHGHNNLMLAVANTLAAVEAGAQIVDGTLRGMGRSAGNAPTEILVGLLERMGWSTGCDLFRTLDVANEILLPLMTRPQGLSDLEVVTGLARFHSGFMPRLTKALEVFPEVDLRRLMLEVSARDCVDPSPDLILEVAREQAGRVSAPSLRGVPGVPARDV